MNITKEQIAELKKKHGTVIGISIEDNETTYRVVLREPSIEELQGAMDGLEVSAEEKNISAGKSIQSIITLYNTCVLYQPEAVNQSGLIKLEAANRFMEYCNTPKKTKVTRL